MPPLCRRVFLVSSWFVLCYCQQFPDMFGGKRCRSPSLHPATFKENVSTRAVFMAVAAVHPLYRIPYVHSYGGSFGVVYYVLAYPRRHVQMFRVRDSWRVFFFY